MNAIIHLKYSHFLISRFVVVNIVLFVLFSNCLCLYFSAEYVNIARLHCFFLGQPAPFQGSSQPMRRQFIAAWLSRRETSSADVRGLRRQHHGRGDGAG